MDASAICVAAEQGELWPEQIGTEPRECACCQKEFQAPRDPGTRPFAQKMFCDPCADSVCFYGEMLMRSKSRRRADLKPKKKPGKRRPKRPASEPERPATQDDSPGEPDAEMRAAASAMLTGQNPRKTGPKK